MDISSFICAAIIKMSVVKPAAALKLESSIGSAPKSSSDFTCANCTVCGDTQCEAKSCNETHDTVCKDCGVCSEGRTNAEGACGPESDSDLTCLKCSRCWEGQYVSQPCYLTHDTVCSARLQSKTSIDSSLELESNVTSCWTCNTFNFSENRPAIMDQYHLPCLHIWAIY